MKTVDHVFDPDELKKSGAKLKATEIRADLGTVGCVPKSTTV